MGKCYNTTVVEAPIDQVWQTIRDFHEMGWAEGVITSCELVGDAAGDQVGAGRILNDAFHETLLSLDDEARQLTYSIDDGPGPVAKDVVENYVGQVRVLPVTCSDRTFVEWTSSYDSDAPQAVSDFCNPIYQALLLALRNHFAG